MQLVIFLISIVMIVFSKPSLFVCFRSCFYFELTLFLKKLGCGDVPHCESYPYPTFFKGMPNLTKRKIAGFSL